MAKSKKESPQEQPAEAANKQAEPIGSISIRWHTPTQESATICRASVAPSASLPIVVIAMQYELATAAPDPWSRDAKAPPGSSLRRFALATRG